MTSTMTPAEAFPPGEYLRDELVARGWSEAEFAEILGRPAQALSEILNGKKEITVETAVAIGAALGTSAELWLNLQSAYRLHTIRRDRPGATDVERRARLRSLVPVRELQKLGWLPDTTSLSQLESAVCNFLGISALDDQLQIDAAARRSDASAIYSPEQIAWIRRVQALGGGRVSTPLDLKRLKKLAAELVRRIHDPIDLGDLHDWLADCGVALVVELPLKGSKIDGVVVFSGDGTPIIGLSTRWDRMDSFIYTLLHEIAHLVLLHVKQGEVQLDEDVHEASAEGKEADANALASEWILPSGVDVGSGKPSMARILGDARSLGVHPSFLIGRLQREGVLGWSDFRRSIPKVRPFVRIG